ncbi:proliferation marker protein Ki-67 [Boleophthalmus pectinirostris]|uniref:proliferation marker protein Ki-67 n=1 Tax=Boleophthalmus pectinirostris TaxID=150288 RepID=UPI000A1C35DF|nr:proliferation marker protein Ki-67 [Boleophthalmus pectinirostris]
MPLHGKIVVLKRSGGDGTEFPLTASCMFGRKPDCDIRIQLPQVSKEHCRIDLNENKEVILTNLSSVNPTQVNGQALQQSERLKHGDIITIIDRSFRFEYPPPPTPKKRSSVGGKVETPAIDPHLKDGANIDNIQRSLEKTQELESKEDTSLLEGKTASPFSDLYQMIKQSLDVKTPRKSSVSVLQTPSSRLCTPRPQSARKSNQTPVEEKGTPQEADLIIPVNEAHAGDSSLPATPKSGKKRRSAQLATERATPAVPTSPRPTPQKFTVSEALEQISQTARSPSGRRSKETTSPVSTNEQVGSPSKTCKMTPKSSEKEKSKKRKNEELAADLPSQQVKRKRVSFGTHLSPELFDKRLPPDSPLRKGATPRRSLSLYKPKQSLLRRASVIGLLKEYESPKAKSPAKMKTPSPKKSSASPKTPTSGKKSPASPKSPASRAQSPKTKTPSPGRKSTILTEASPKAKSPTQKVQTPKSSSPRKTPTPKKASPKTPKSPKAVSPKGQTPKSKSPSPGKGATPRKVSLKTPSPKSVKTTPSKFTEETPKRKSPGLVVKTPLLSADQTPKVQGRFSVSRIDTPSPIAEDVVVESVPSAMVTPKIPLRRKSMKSSAKKTPTLKSAAKVMRRKSGIMRASMKVMTSWADIVRFGKAKVQVAVPSKSQVTKKTKKKKAVPKPQTPKRRLVDHVSTGHAASPATIVVGRAHRLRVAHSGAPPKIVTNTAVLRKNLLQDEDLTGISDMFKTPKNEKRQSTKITSATRTPLTDVNKSQIEPSVLNTPEETGEMVVSPMSVASTVKGRRYNSEAVQRLLDEVPLMDIQCESTEHGIEVKVNTPRTQKSKLQAQESLTGVKRMKTPKQKVEPVEDLRGKLLKTPKEKFEQQECLSAVKHIMKTPKDKIEPVEDLRGKLLKTPKQKIEQQEDCLTGVKRIMKTPKEKALPVEDLQGKLLKTPKQKPEMPDCLSTVKMIMKTPDQKVEQPERISGAKGLARTPKHTTEQPECLTRVKRIMKTPKEKSEVIDDIRGKLLLTPKQKGEQQVFLTGVKRIMRTPKQKVEQQVFLTGVKRIMRTPKEKGQPVEKNFGLKRLLRSPRLRGHAPVEDFEGLEELMKEPIEEQTSENAEETVDGQPETSEQAVVDQTKSDKVITPKEVVVDQPESTSIFSEDVSETSAVESIQGSLGTKHMRGRRAKVSKPKVEDKQDLSEETVQAPVKSRRLRKVECTAPRQTTRGRTAKVSKEEESEEPVHEESVPESTVKPVIPKTSEESSQEQIEEVKISPIEPLLEMECEQNLHTAVQKVEIPAASEQPAVKLRRGRKTKAAKPCDVTVTAASNATPSAKAPESNEIMPSNNQNGDAPEKLTKPACGRRVMETDAEKGLVPAEDAKNEEVSAFVPVRGRRGKKIEAPADPAVKQRRGRAGKGQKSTETVNVLPEETRQEAESVPEQADDPTCVSEPAEEIQEKYKRGKKIKAPVDPEPKIIVVESELPAQLELSVPNEKPKRGRRAKTQEEPAQPEAESAVEEASPPAVDEAVDMELSVPTEKPKRGRKLKSAAEPLQTETEITEVKSKPVVKSQTEKPKRGRRARPAESIQSTEVSQNPIQEKRGRSAKLEEGHKSVPEQQPSNVIFPEPPKKMRGIRKVEEPSEELQIKETAEKTPVIAEPVRPEPPAPRSRRGAPKRKEAENITPEEDTEEVSVSSATNKPKRGRASKQEAKGEIKESEVNAPEQASEDDTAQAKPTRRRGRLAAPAVPAKRARRGALVPSEESPAQATEEICESVTVEPVKRGRRATKMPAYAQGCKSQDNSTLELSNEVEDTGKSKRSVKWNSDFQVIEVTPLKTIRGRKTKSAQKNEAENVPHNATNAEEKDLSENAQPVKRARRGVKAAVEEESTKTNVDNTKAETQPKTRRGRVAKK